MMYPIKRFEKVSLIITQDKRYSKRIKLLQGWDEVAKRFACTVYRVIFTSVYFCDLVQKKISRI